MDERLATDLRYRLESLDATMALGAAIGASMPGGVTIGLVGPLGVGKTHLVKAIAIGNGLDDPAAVTSPTFTLVQEYPGRLHLFHIDVYRLRNAAELSSLGFDEMVQAEAAVVVEWADRVRGLMPGDTLWVRLEPAGPNQREATLRACGPLSRQCLVAVKASVDTTACTSYCPADRPDVG